MTFSYTWGHGITHREANQFRMKSVFGGEVGSSESGKGPFYNRGSTFPLFFVYEKTGFVDPNSSKKNVSVDLGRGAIRHDAF